MTQWYCSLTEKIVLQQYFTTKMISTRTNNSKKGQRIPAQGWFGK
jgi:hypothetical protein